MKKTVFLLCSIFFLCLGLPLQAHAVNDPQTKSMGVSSISSCSGYSPCDTAHMTAALNSGTFMSSSTGNNGGDIRFVPTNVSNGQVISFFSFQVGKWAGTPSNVAAHDGSYIFDWWTSSHTVLVSRVTQLNDHTAGAGLGTVNLTGSPTAYTFSMIPPTGSTWHTGDVLEFNDGICNGTGCSTIMLNDVTSGSYTYLPVPTLSVSSLVASSSAQNVTFNASGDTQYTQAGEQCKISLYEYDISTPANPRIVNGGVAYVLLNANAPRTSTLYQGQSTYLGYGFTSSVSTWEADNITMPYFNNKSTDIRSYTSCYHQNTNADGSLTPPIYDIQQQALDPASAIKYDTSLIATPSALQNATGYAQPQCTSTDIICQIVENIQVGLTTLFAPNATVDSDDFASINNAMLSRAPFAYAEAALGTNTTITTVASNSATSLTFDFSNITGVPIPTQYQHMSYTDNGTIQSNIYAPFRPYEVIILWVIFLMYLVFLMRSIFT